METWKKWIPVEGMPQTFYIDKILAKNGLFITLKSDVYKKSIVFIFDGPLLSNRKTKRNVLSKKIDALKEQYGSQFFDEWSLFIVENSDYCKWLIEGSYGFYENQNVIHYVFMGSNSVFEVLAPYEPDVEIKNI